MARRLTSLKYRGDGGPVEGGSGFELKVYDDEALTTPSSLFQRPTGVGTQPNPIKPNAGPQTTLTADRALGDSFVDVADVTGFQVGDLQPIYDGTNTVYRVITAIDGGTKRITLDQALGFAFTAAATLVGNEDMTGHIWFYLDDALDYFAQPKEVASGRLLPPLALPVRVATTALAVQDEGTLAGERSAINFIGAAVTAVDNAVAERVDITVTAPTQASFDDHSTRHEVGGADAMAVDAIAATGSLRTLGAGAQQAAAGNHATTLDTAEATLAANVTLPTWTDIVSVSLAAGKWLVIAYSQQSINDANLVSMRITDGTTHYASSELRQVYAPTQSGGSPLKCAALITLASTTTIKMQGIAGTALAALGGNPTGNHACRILAVKVAP